MLQCRVCDPGAGVDPADPPAATGEQDGEEGDERLTCPTCGRELGPPVKAPWHFKLLVVSVVIYLGWRGWQGVEWALGKL